MTIRHSANRPSRRRVFQLSLSTLLASFLILPAAFAAEEGVYIETLNHSTGLMGETPQEDQNQTFLAYGKMKVSDTADGGSDMLLDPATGTMTFINHAAKKYYQINIKNVKDSMSQPGMEQMRNMIADTKISVQDTGETQQIGSWNCHKYLVSKTGMMGVEQEIWATEDVDLDMSRFTEMTSLAGPDGLLANTSEGKAQLDEMAKIKGFPILTKTKMQMMGSSIETESEVKVIRKEAMEPSIFDIPKDYAQREMGAGMSPNDTPADAAHP